VACASVSNSARSVEYCQAPRSARYCRM
jgi:hypothetical protein